jgi:hypothetical protein
MRLYCTACKTNHIGPSTGCPTKTAAAQETRSAVEVSSTDWLEDWQRRYDKAEREWDDAKWARYAAEKREAKLGEKVLLLRREYRAAQSSNDQAELSQEAR